MKKILLTWYGITDLKASFGTEYSNGPILSALTSEEYTDILILGYTNKEKNNLEEKNFTSELLEAQNAFKENKQFDVWNFINKYSNTDLAHNHFVTWIKQKLKSEEIKTGVNIHTVELTHLNDTE